jgi:endoglucanase
VNVLVRFILAGGVSVSCLLCARLRAEEVALPALKVEGNHLVTLSGEAVNLHGVDIPSLEWSQGDHLSNSLAVASDWGANIIRLPLSQDRWFGHTPEREDGGEHYREVVEDFVGMAAARKCYVILDLHWSDGGVWGEYIGQHNMPDDNSVPFWENVGAKFANNPYILFDIYNEPHDVSWEVWQNGGMVKDKNTKADPAGTLEYHTPGMQKLLDVCRAQGAKNVVIAGGVDWAYDLRGIAKGYALKDTNGYGVIYDTHIYPMKEWYSHGGTTSQDWDNIIMSTGTKYPVMIGEFGNGTNNYEAQVLDFAKTNSLPWVAWCLHPYARPCLIKDWQYTTTKYGATVKDALRDAPEK